ncbi:MAG: hypothetical protein WCE57_06755, partial [Salegentibacter sp.]
FNIKLGAKLGGLFYFRPEIGYAFNKLPKSIEYGVVYDNGDKDTDSIDFDPQGYPEELLFQGLIANIGFGFAF